MGRNGIMVTEHLVGTKMTENGNGEHGLKLMNLRNVGLKTNHGMNRIADQVIFFSLIQGMGVNILLDVIRMVKPSHIIQLNYTSEESVNKNLPAITEEFLMNTPGWAFADDADDEIESVHKDQR